MKKLFVSFTSLLRLVAEGHVTAEDLRQGLFFFGCWRDHALDADALRLYADGTRYSTAQAAIADAVRRAEGEGRAAWHNGPKRHGNPWRKLDDLLCDNGFPPLKVQHDIGSHYCYPGARDAVADKGLNLEVVY